MPRNIFNFTIKYINNTPATSKNLCKWSLSSTSACSFCFQSETFQHNVSSCKSYLDDGRYTWRQNSALLHLANSLSSLFLINLLISLLSHPFLWLLEILSDLILSLYSIILLFICWNLLLFLNTTLQSTVTAN